MNYPKRDNYVNRTKLHIARALFSDEVPLENQLHLSRIEDENRKHRPEITIDNINMGTVRQLIVSDNHFVA